MHPEPAVPPPVAAVPELGALYRRSTGWAWPLVRVAIGAPLIPHGVQKLAGLFGLDLGRPAGFLEGADAPFGPFWSYAFAMLQIVAGGLVIAGLGTRVAAALIAGLMLASVAVHWPAGFYWTGRGFEYPLLLLLLAVALMIRGGGEHSVDRKLGVEI